jgi:hypothetical protein
MPKVRRPMFDAYPLHVDTRLADIAAAFGATRNGQVFVNALYIFGLLAIVVVISLGVKRLLHLRDDEPAKRRARTLDILGQALLHRSRIDASFHPIDTARLVLSCALERVDADRLSLELPGGVETSRAWIGRELICFFRIPGDQGNPFFYKFIAPIIDVRRYADIRYLDLALPEYVELGQKRRHMRLEVPKNDVVDFRIWPGLDDQPLPCEADPDRWPEPLAVYRPDLDSQMHVLDLSGGGIRLEYDPRQFPTLNAFLRRYPTLFMRLELVPMAPKLPCIYYMTARLRTKQENFGTGSFMLGYEFVECGQSQAEGDIKWITIEPDHGIEDLVTWIFKRHLELYREHEIG